MGHNVNRGVRAAIAAVVAWACIGAEVAHGQTDLFQDATVLTPNETFVTPNDSYTSTGEPLSATSTYSCQDPGTTYTVDIDRTFWWKVIGTGGPITLSTFTHSNVDTVIAVYQPNALPADSTGLDCNDDLYPNDPNITHGWSQLTFASVKGATYFTQWGNCASAAMPPICPGTPGTIAYTALTNDPRAYADPGAGPRSNIGATVEAGERTDCKGVPFGATVWFSYEAPAAGAVTFEVSDLTGRFAVAVYRGSTFVDCDAAGSLTTARSQLTVPNVAKGERLLVQVGGKDAGGFFTEDNFVYRVTFTENQDLDGDGFLKPPGPDCDDANPAVRPGAADIPGNRIDEDCKDGDAPYPRLTSTVEVGATRGRLTLLRAKRVPAGATIKVTCNRRRCLRRSTVKVTKAGTVSLLGAMRRRRLSIGTTLTVRVTLPNHVGTFTSIKVGKKRRLSKRDACLPPGATRPVRC